MTNKTNLQQLADQNISLNNQLNKLIILKTSPEKPKKKVTATFVNKSNYVNIISGNGSKVINMPTQKNFNSPLENKIVTLPYAAPYFPDNENINNNSQYENIYNSILNKSNKQNTLLNEKKIKNTFLTQETDFMGLSQIDKEAVIIDMVW